MAPNYCPMSGSDVTFDLPRQVKEARAECPECGAVVALIRDNYSGTLKSYKWHVTRRRPPIVEPVEKRRR